MTKNQVIKLGLEISVGHLGGKADYCRDSRFHLIEWA